jgi:thiosulfate/3-mercaptopyruvate sulfurtransferase
MTAKTLSWPLRCCLALVGIVLLVGAAAPAPAKTDPWSARQVAQPAAFAQALAAKTGAKPLVICVGFPVLYQGGHIAGAEFGGPGSSAAGRAALRKLVAGLPRSRAIVLYCGCCPWTMCPNIRPAFSLLKGMGFTNVKVLELAHNFRTDWAGHGYRVVRGAASR